MGLHQLHLWCPSLWPPSVNPVSLPQWALVNASCDFIGQPGQMWARMVQAGYLNHPEVPHHLWRCLG